ncbi:MAG: hypothetical protein AUJ21_08610 [Anaerolineae bacterium CG1_02_58_13]|nr:MAG: hypothetical protein AUJ21_08610 [Anaerolineae bacterium CG1_02_58_13]
MSVERLKLQGVLLRVERLTVKIKIARLAVVASLIWNVLLFFSLTLSFFGSEEKAPLGVQLAQSQGILVIGALTLAIHIIAIKYLRQEPVSTFSKIIVVLNCGWMLTLAFLTGFTIGLLVLPSPVLLLLASILLLTDGFPLNKQG